MKVHEKTRVDVSIRLELVTNRIGALADEAKKIETDMRMLEDEKTALLSLKRLYDASAVDIIDNYRAEIFRDEEPPVKNGRGRKNGTQGIVCDILKNGPASRMELAQRSGLSDKQIENAVCNLRRKGVIKKYFGSHMLVKEG